MGFGLAVSNFHPFGLVVMLRVLCAEVEEGETEREKDDRDELHVSMGACDVVWRAHR